MVESVCGQLVDQQQINHNNEQEISQVGDHGGLTVDHNCYSHQPKWVVIHNPQSLLPQLPDQIITKSKVANL
jgi:hypothetical protein